MWCLDDPRLKDFPFSPPLWLQTPMNSFIFEAVCRGFARVFLRAVAERKPLSPSSTIITERVPPCFCPVRRFRHGR